VLFFLLFVLLLVLDVSVVVYHTGTSRPHCIWYLYRSTLFDHMEFHIMRTTM